MRELGRHILLKIIFFYLFLYFNSTILKGWFLRTAAAELAFIKT